MNANRSLLALTLTLLVGACAPVTTYTDAEAPKRLRLDSATTQLDVRFVPGTAQLSPADAARLRQIAATGGVDPADRVTVAAAGAPSLSEQRLGSVSSVLLHYGVVPIAVQLAEVPPNHAIIMVDRTLVTLPPCPNWSKRPGTDFGNQPSSNFGCATETNLGMMIANPSDLASGLPVGTSSGRPASSAVYRYLTDKVELPTANSSLPIATQTSTQQGAGTPNASPSGSQ
jgi:pilus assembly protein CpaD